MPLRASLRGAVAALRTRPELLVLGGAVALVQTGLIGVWFSVMPPDAGIVVGTVAVLLSLLVVLPLFVGLYELTLRPVPGEPSVAALRRAVATALGRYPAVVRADAVVAVASVPLAVAGALAWFVAVTGGRFVRYIVADPAPPSIRWSFLLVLLASVLGAVLGSTCFRFADCLAAFDGHASVDAVARSAAASRRHLASFAGFAAAAVVHVASLLVLAGAVVVSENDPSAPVFGALVAAVALYGLVVTFVGVLHAVFYRDHVAPAAGSAGTGVSLRRFVADRSPARVALAVVLVVGLVSGAVAVRALDPGVHSPPEQSPIATDDPDVALRTAAERTAASSRRQVLHRRNVSDPGSDFRVSIRSGIDYADRQTYVFLHGDSSDPVGGFYGEGTMAMIQPGGYVSGWLAYERGRWSVLALPAWGIAGGGASEDNVVVPDGSTDGWRVVAANDSAMVVRLSDPDRIDEALEPRYFAGAVPPLADESYVTAVIDRERGVLEAVRFHLHSRETGRNFEYRLEYREVGTADLRRPEPIRDRRLAERLWDALYY